MYLYTREGMSSSGHVCTTTADFQSMPKQQLKSSKESLTQVILDAHVHMVQSILAHTVFCSALFALITTLDASAACWC